MTRKIGMTDEPAGWQRYFDPDERLLWQGRPVPGLGIDLPTCGLALFGLPFLGGGIFMMVTAVRDAMGASGIDNDFGPLGLFVFSLPFSAIGFGLVFGIWWYQYRLRKTARYAVTNKRAYIAHQVWNRKLEVHPIHPEAEITMEEGRTTSVTFAVKRWTDSDGDRQKQEHSFLYLEDGEVVYDILRKVQRGDA